MLRKAIIREVRGLEYIVVSQPRIYISVFICAERFASHNSLKAKNGINVQLTLVSKERYIKNSLKSVKKAERVAMITTRRMKPRVSPVSKLGTWAK